jgi:hypothetical protein
MSEFTTRHIKYRAKSITNAPLYDLYVGDRVYGTYTERGNQAIIVTARDRPVVTVDPGSVSEFTGLYDKHDTELYEIDIFIYRNQTYLVEFKNGAFGYNKGCNFISFAQDSGLNWINNKSEEIEVVGNKIDNPYLLEMFKLNDS